MFIKKHINSNSKPKKEEKKENKEKGNSDITEYWFFVNRWFDTSEDDKQIERELIPTDEKGNPIQSPTGIIFISSSVNFTLPTFHLGVRGYTMTNY